VTTDRAKQVAGVVAVVAVLWLGRWLAPWLVPALEAIREMGPIGVVVFVVLYLVSTVLMLPATPLSLGAGVLWGPVVGTLIVWPTATVGAQLAFLIGRSGLRDRVSAWIGQVSVFSAVNDAIREQGFRTVLLMRLSPVFPFSLSNYALGLSSVGAWSFFGGTTLGMVPGVVAYVSVGAAVGTFTGTGGVDLGATGAVLLAIGVVATFVVTVLVGRRATALLRSRESP
jgi:uncharacterized membrane protein YdjX (TVP38/TMEM64 family)